jgi:hypothetical protein
MALSLSSAVNLENISLLSPTGATVLVAFLAGRILNHLKQRTSVEKRHNDQNAFWDTHQRLDNMLLDVSLNLPDHLRLPLGMDNPNVVFVNMNLQALTICLHQTAVLKANTNENLRTRFGNESASRCIAAAVAITSFMRMVAHTDLAAVNDPNFCPLRSSANRTNIPLAPHIHSILSVHGRQGIHSATPKPSSEL